MPRKYSNTSKSYGNPNKVVSTGGSSHLVMDRRVYRRTFTIETANVKQEKEWSKDTTSSAVVDKIAAFEIGKELAGVNR